MIEKLYKKLDKEFGFTFVSQLDRKEKWEGVVFCFPQVKREVSYWVERSYRKAKKGITVVCVLPSSTDTAWWHDYVMKAVEIRFLRGRLKLDGHSGTATYAHVVVVFDSSGEEIRFGTMQGYMP